MTLLTQHRVAAQAVHRSPAAYPVVAQKLGAVLGIVDLQDGNRGGLEVGDVVAGAQGFPEGLFAFVELVGRAVGIFVGVAVGAVGHVDGVGAGEIDRLARQLVDYRPAGFRVHQRHPCLLVGRDVALHHRQGALGQGGIEERGEGQSEGIPDAGVGEHDGHVVQHRRLGEDDGALLPRVVQVATL